MKKVFVVVFVFVLSMTALASCNKNSSSQDPVPSSKTNEGISTKLEENALITTEEAVLTEEAVNITDSITEKPVQDENVYSIVDQVIVDNETCSFTVSSIKENGTWGFAVKVLCENKTDDKNLVFTWDNVSVLGYMIDPFWASTVAPGKKSNVEISFSDDKLSQCGINSVDEIVFDLRVSDDDDYMADPYLDETFTIYPTGLASDTVVYPSRTSVENETIIVDDEKVAFIIESVDEDSTWGYTLNCYIENKTGNNVMFSWDNVSVNGFMCDPFWARSISAGKKEFVEISFSQSSFEENGITDVSEIEFSLRVSNDDDWTADDILESVFTFTP